MPMRKTIGSIAAPFRYAFACSSNDLINSSRMSAIGTPCSLACISIHSFACGLIRQLTAMLSLPIGLRPAPALAPPHPVLSCFISYYLVVFPFFAGGRFNHLTPPAKYFSCTLTYITPCHIKNQVIASPTLDETEILLHCCV